MTTDSFTDTTVVPGTEYTYALDARNQSGVSAQGTPQSIATRGTIGKSTFNVLDYGADPTGKALSSTAFLNARLAAQKYGAGGTIYAPHGVYFIDDVAGTPNCIHLETPGIALMGDGDSETAGTKLLLATSKIGGNARRWGLVGIAADGCAVGELFLDSRSSPGNNTHPQLSKNPDPEILSVTSNHNRISNVSGRSGTGFCVRFIGPSPCYGFGVGDNQITGGVLDGLSYGGGFITLDVDCQGKFGPGLWTIVKDVSIFGQMAAYNDCYLLVDGLTMSPNVYNPPCAACIEITTTGKGPSHDHTYQNIVSNGGKIKVESYDGAPPMQNLSLPGGQYWKAGC